MKWLHIVAWILVVVGAINWGLVGVSGFMDGNWNLVHLVFGSMPALEWVIYILVGVSGIFELATHRKNCRTCGSDASAAM